MVLCINQALYAMYISFVFILVHGGAAVIKLEFFKKTAESEIVTTTVRLIDYCIKISSDHEKLPIMCQGI